MQFIRRWFSSRRETIRRLPWLRPVLLAIDIAFLFLGLIPGIGFAVGVIGIVISELFTPVVVRRVFIKDLSVVSPVIASIHKEVMRHPKDSS